MRSVCRARWCRCCAPKMNVRSTMARLSAPRRGGAARRRANSPEACNCSGLLRFFGLPCSFTRCAVAETKGIHQLKAPLTRRRTLLSCFRPCRDATVPSSRRSRWHRCRRLRACLSVICGKNPAPSLASQEICFYLIPTEKENAAGVKPELMKTFPSGHEEPVTKIVLLDVDRVRLACGM